MKSHKDYFEIAEKINNEVSVYLSDNFGPVKEMTQKAGSHYSIKEDLVANQMYEEFLRKETPEVALYTEEGERNLASDLVWVIDPIEGTSNYRSGNPFFATQIVLVEKNEPVVSVVNSPILKQKFTAIKGQGAFLNEEKIKPTSQVELPKSLVEMGRGTADADKDWYVDTLGKIIKKVKTCRSFGSAGLCLSYTAAGIFDVYINNGSQIYDLVSGALIATEAGASVLNFEGRKWSITDGDNIVVSNSELSQQILKLIK